MPVAAFDVWLVSTNTVYRGVPFGAVTDWAQQGRLSPDDKIKDAGPGENWERVADHAVVGDYLFVRTADNPTIPTKPTEAIEPIEMDVGWKKIPADDDDDPDMIPLIDISLVLLIFFMMTASVASMSPFPNPDVVNAANLVEDPDAFGIEIDKDLKDEAKYSLRLGLASPEPNADSLPTLAELLKVLDAKINERLARNEAAPSIHVSCHKELPSDKLLEVVSELEKRKRDSKVRAYVTVVNEGSK